MSRATGSGVIAILIGAFVLAGCSSSPSNQSANTTTTSGAPATTSTTAAAAAASCTQSAILAAAKSSTSTGPVSSVSNYGCSGSWAYANVTVGSGSASFDAVIVLHAQGSGWVVADRATACSGHMVPSAIYTQGCASS
jgi:hypothetical protein